MKVSISSIHRVPNGTCRAEIMIQDDELGEIEITIQTKDVIEFSEVPEHVRQNLFSFGSRLAKAVDGSGSVR